MSFLLGFQRELNADAVPLRNEHDLCSSDDIVSRTFPRTTVDMAPTGENADRYSDLSGSWGKHAYYRSAIETVSTSLREPEDERSPKPCKSNIWCHLCRKLGVVYSEYCYDLSIHMKNRHGTDLEGNLLSEDRTPTK